MKKLLLAVIMASILGNSGFAQCTCPAGCSSLTDITLPFAKDGAGEYCFRTSCTITTLNSWNTEKIEVNGVDCTNTWTDASILPPSGDGYTYIYYKGIYAYSHLEVNGSCTGSVTPALTNPPEENTPVPTNSSSDTAGPTTTPMPTTIPTATPSLQTPVPTDSMDGTPVPTPICLPCTTSLRVYVIDAVTGEMIEGACVVGTSYCTSSSGSVVLPGQPTCEATFTASVTVSKDGYETQTISGTFSCGGSVTFSLVPLP